MKKYKLVTLFTLLLCQISFSQEGEDMLLPKQESKNASLTESQTPVSVPSDSPFSLGKSIEGLIENSVNAANGKVAFNVPIATIAAKSVSFPVSFSYNGQSAFQQGRKTNEYAPTSTLGVGWSFTIPKIIADHKNTGTREDDTFYMVDGGSTIELLPIGQSGGIWSYRPQSYAPIEVTFNTTQDEWKVVDENGRIFIYSDRSYLSTWGNWIGSTRQTPTGRMSFEWRIKTIKDQWDVNYLTFMYDVVEGRNNSSQTTNKHTEASYVSEIISSQGGKVVFNYSNKHSHEYFEPYTQTAEPDAYQERFEKKYLTNVSIYNSNNNIKFTYDLKYLVVDTQAASTKKRYLTSITKGDGLSQSLPSQEFEYHTAVGAFQGGIEKITYPSGGTVTYDYENKLLFSNSRKNTSAISDYTLLGVHAGESYALKFYISNQEYGTDLHRLRAMRYVWSGDQFVQDEIYDFDNKLFEVGGSPIQRLQQVEFVFKGDFYGILNHRYSTDSADLFLFHLNWDGRSWDTYKQINLYVGAGDPKLMAGDEYVSVGTHHQGSLKNYFWAGDDWRFKSISQGNGQYYYGAGHNFIIALNEDGGYDFITGQARLDNYYIHYLDSEKKWVSKSWTDYMLARVATVELPSHFFPGRTMTGYIAHDNPEFFLRWDTNYNVNAVDDVIGAYDDDRNLIYSSFNNMNTISWFWAKEPSKSSRFNGSAWNVKNIGDGITSGQTYNTYIGEDMILSREEYNPKRFFYKRYNPNTNTWSNHFLQPFTNHVSYHAAITRNFAVAGNHLYTRNWASGGTLGGASLLHPTKNTSIVKTNHNDHILVELGQNPSEKLTKLISRNKETNQIQYEDFPNNFFEPFYLHSTPVLDHAYMSNSNMFLRGQSSSSGGFTVYLHRLIEDKQTNDNIYDVVVDKIILDSQTGLPREIDYSYTADYTNASQTNTFYGEVTIKNNGSGIGSGNIGYTKQYFNTGETDARMAGLMEKQEIRDASGNLESETINNWSVVLTNSYYNGQYHISTAFSVKLMDTYERQKFEGTSQIETTTDFTYNNLGLKTSQTTTNSLGLSERQDISYAYQYYSFVDDKNMLNLPYEITERLNGEIISIGRTEMATTASGKVYPKKILSKANTSDFRLISEITNIDDNGNILEVHDGNGVYLTTLYGYDHKYAVATVNNARFSEVIAELDYSYSELQNLESGLKSALLPLYSGLPLETMTHISLFDSEGHLVTEIDSRKQEINYTYDSFGRQIRTLDKDGNILDEKKYNFGSN
ncbi:hypothetical protein [Aureisphaera sp.]